MENDMKPLKAYDKRIIAPELKTKIEQLIREKNLNLCFQCGRCSAVCPMLDFYMDYVYERSPRGVVDRILFDPEDVIDESLWYCLACQKCTAFCPSGIDFQGFMTKLRELLLQHGYKNFALFCPGCGGYLMPKKEYEYLKKGTDGKTLGDLLSVCHRCKQNNYAEILHRLAPWPKKSRAGRSVN